MALSNSLQNIIPIMRQARTIFGPHLPVRNLSSIRAKNTKSAINPSRKYSCCTSALCSKWSMRSSRLCADAQSNLLPSMRFICGRENCADPCDFPRCSPENIAKSECMQKRIERKKNQNPKTIYEVYWNRPECCSNECIDSFPRFDDMYYRESDKENRIYTQTWNECPDLVILPKPICCTEKVKIPPVCKRNPKDKPVTAHNMDDSCPPDLRGSCPKIRMPCCRQARTLPCRKEIAPKDCTKFLAPSPSFSECRKPEIRARKISECWCLAAPSMCQVWAEWRRLQKVKRVPRG